MITKEINQKQSILRHITIKLQKTRNEKFASNHNQMIPFFGKTILMTIDFIAKMVSH